MPKGGIFQRSTIEKDGRGLPYGDRYKKNPPKRGGPVSADFLWGLRLQGAHGVEGGEDEDADVGEDGVPDWVKPLGAADAYQTGDVVRFEGSLWRSRIDGNVWSPTEYPAGWEQVQ